MSLTIKKITAIFFSLMFIAGFAMHSHAQEQNNYQQQQGMNTQAADVDVSDKQVEQFADAYADVRDLQKDFSNKLENIKNQEKARALQQETQQKMIQAVEESGLSLEEYNQIVSAMDSNDELRQRIESAM